MFHFTPLDYHQRTPEPNLQFPRENYTKRQLDVVHYSLYNPDVFEDITDLDPLVYSEDHMAAIMFTNRKINNIDISDLDPSKYNPIQLQYIINARAAGVSEDIISMLDPARYDMDQMLIIIAGARSDKVMADVSDLNPVTHDYKSMLTISVNRSKTAKK